jgi:hypothetical protein
LKKENSKNGRAHLIHLSAFAVAQLKLLGSMNERAFVLAGHTGVSLFFVLSGFLLAGPFLAEAAGGARVARRAYAARRVLRVMPAYVAAVTVASIDCAIRPLEVLRGVPYLFFLESIPGMTTPLIPYSDVWWTLATEAQFYLTLPLLAWAWRAVRRRTRVAPVRRSSPRRRNRSSPWRRCRRCPPPARSPCPPRCDHHQRKSVVDVIETVFDGDTRHCGVCLGKGAEFTR